MTHRTETLNSILPEQKDGTISSVVVLPERMEFETQNPNEQVYILLRRHIFSNIGWVLGNVILAVIPLVLFIILNWLSMDFLGDFSIKMSYILVAACIWYLFLITRSFMGFLDWYFNIYLVTNERVIDFDFNAFAYHKISETGLENIVDATQETIGFFPMIFNYGDVYIQTAGERREFDFLAVTNPSWVRDKIMDLRDLVKETPK